MLTVLVCQPDCHLRGKYVVAGWVARVSVAPRDGWRPDG
jgi:hypothetical protein